MSTPSKRSEGARRRSAAPRARIDFRIPGLLRSYTNGAERITLDVASEQPPPRLDDALAALDARCPGLRFRIIDEHARIRPHIKLFVDGTQARDLASPLPASAEVIIVGALSGG